MQQYGGRADPHESRLQASMEHPVHPHEINYRLGCLQYPRLLIDSVEERYGTKMTESS